MKTIKFRIDEDIPVVAEAYEWSPYGCRNSSDVEELRRLLTV